jgi:hypothetical protein
MVVMDSADEAGRRDRGHPTTHRHAAVFDGRLGVLPGQYS